MNHYLLTFLMLLSLCLFESRAAETSPPTSSDCQALIKQAPTDWSKWSPDQDVQVKLIFDQSITATEHLVIGHAKLSFEEKLPLHYHAQTETYRIISGLGIMTLGDKEFVVRPGDYVFIPANTLHQIVGHSKGEDLIFEFTFPETNLENVIYNFIHGE